MPNPLPTLAAGALVLLVTAPAPLLAQSSTPAAPPVSFSAYFQTQYARVEGGSDARDRLFFRRMVLTADAKPFRDWEATLQVDLAPITLGERAIVKDAYLRYTGWGDHGWTLTLGNQKTPFSRSILQSSARRGLVERPVTGEKAFGGPGRAISLRADGWAAGERLYVGAAIASALHAPPSNQIRIDGLPEARADWNEGLLASGRVEWHPFGRMADVHGTWDADEGTRMMIGAAAYAWRNDGDRNLQTPDADDAADVDAVNAVELGAGLRAGRLTIDGELQRVSAATTAAGFTGGVYVNGATVLHKAAVEGGWMVRERRVEFLASADVADADGYARPWRRGAVGLNWYVHGHDLKFQFMHRVSRNTEGVAGARTQATHVQAQIGF